MTAKGKVSGPAALRKAPGETACGRRSFLSFLAMAGSAAAGWTGRATPAGAAGLAQVAGPDAPPDHPLVYVALGASDAVGVGASDPATTGWVPQLSRRFPDGTQLVNLGVSGTTLHAALAQQLPAALAAAPDVVTMWLVVNDFNAHVPLDQYAADLDTLLGALGDQTAARVAVGNVPDLSSVPVYAGQNPALLRAEVARWNAAIADIVARHGAILVDLAAQWQELAAHPEYVAADGFHPGDDGYRRLADLFWAALAPAGGA